MQSSSTPEVAQLQRRFTAWVEKSKSALRKALNEVRFLATSGKVVTWATGFALFNVVGLRRPTSFIPEKLLVSILRLINRI